MIYSLHMIGSMIPKLQDSVIWVCGSYGVVRVHTLPLSLLVLHLCLLSSVSMNSSSSGSYSLLA